MVPYEPNLIKYDLLSQNQVRLLQYVKMKVLHFLEKCPRSSFFFIYLALYYWNRNITIIVIYTLCFVDVGTSYIFKVHIIITATYYHKLLFGFIRWTGLIHIMCKLWKNLAPNCVRTTRRPITGWNREQGKYLLLSVLAQ